VRRRQVESLVHPSSPLPHVPSVLPGKKAPRFKEELPKATKLLEQRTAPLELDSNLNKTMIVSNPGGRGAGQPGFYVSISVHATRVFVISADSSSEMLFPV
jgi:hypothetical protein